MESKFVQDGDAIDYTPSGAVSAGEVVVQGSLIGIAKSDIAANRLGALSIRGVADFAKATGGGKAITGGSHVYWDDSADQVTTDAGSGQNTHVRLGTTIPGGPGIADADEWCRVAYFPT